MTSSRRVMVADFDSVRQRELWLQRGEHAASEQLTAMLRLACLLEGRLLLTDSQLLDGMYFVTHGPDDVAALLGCDRLRLPLTISVDNRFPTLRGSYAGKRGALGFEWSTEIVAKAMRPEEVATVLEQQEGRRKEWLAAVERGGVATAAFQPLDPVMMQRHWSEDMASASSSVPPQIWPELMTFTERSKARTLIEERLGPLDQNYDAWGLYERWNSAYQGALAESNDASWLASDAMSRRRHRGRSTLAVAGSLLDDLTRVSGPVHALVVHRAANAVTQWRGNPSQRSINHVAFAVKETLSAAPTYRQTFWSALLRLAVPLLLTATLLGFTQASEVGPEWLPFATAFLSLVAVVPLGDLPAILESRRGKLKAVIRVDLT